MQRVVRSTLVGLLTVAGLTACGDKITIPPATSAPLDNVVRSVTVSPSVVANLAVGGSVTLAASVDAGAGVTDRTVTWSSSDATVAQVDAAGKVTGVKVGVATITAASKAAADVKGASVVTVIAAGGGTPQVIVTGITKNGTNQPVNIAGVAGQIDVLLDVQTNGATLRTVSATLNCPGSTTMTQTQTIAGAAGSDASESQIPVILSFPTAAFEVANGVGTPKLRNGSCSLVASATTGAAGSPQTATTTTQLTLANPNAVTFNNTFTAVPNAEGITPTSTQATDQFGLPWRRGSVTVTAIPIIYGNIDGTTQTISRLTLTLPGASSTPTVELTAAPFSQTWSANPATTSGPRVQNVVITGGCCEVGNNVPLPTSPTAIAVDAAGNSIDLVETGGGTNVAFRLDNEAPQAPLVFNIPGRQQGWVNAAYTFTGAGTGTGNANVNQTTGSSNFGSCGDGPAPTAAPYLCSAQRGVSGAGVGAAPVTTNTSTNANMTYSYYVIPAASYTTSNTASENNGTSTSPTACSTTGWTKVATAGDIASASSPNNASFVVRVFETDKLGNARCTDVSLPPATVGQYINTGANFFAANKGTFGIDVVNPTAIFAATSATDMQIVSIAAPAIPNFELALSDDASGFSLTPVSTVIRRLAPSGTSCAIGSGTACNAVDFSGTAPGDGSPAQGIGYYTYTGTARDLARNAAPTLTRQIVVDNVAAPTMGSIATPVSINGGSSVTFATSAADDLDLIEWDNTLAYAATPNGGAQPLSIRSARTQIHARFSGTLITSQALSIVVPTFIRTMSVTGAAGAVPVGTAGAVLPASIAARAYDAGGNASTPNAGTGAGFSNIPAASINTTTNALTDWSVSPNVSQPGAVMTSFNATNAAVNISNCPTAGCAGNVAPVNATSVTLTAAATGATGANFQFANPFSQVQFYYLDAVSNEYILIGSTSVPVVTDPAAGTRVFTFSFSWDPPAALGVGAVTIVAVGVNSRGDALASPVNANVTLTNP